MMGAQSTREYKFHLVNPQSTCNQQPDAMQTDLSDKEKEPVHIGSCIKDVAHFAVTLHHTTPNLASPGIFSIFSCSLFLVIRMRMPPRGTRSNSLRALGVGSTLKALLRISAAPFGFSKRLRRRIAFE